jgi:hypothetical protein
MVYLLIIAGCLFFYPKQSLQWLLATVIAGCVSGWIIDTYYNYDIRWFFLYFVLTYAPIMWVFGLLNRRAKVSVSSANDNGSRAKA